MNLKTSFFNKSVVRSDFKRLWWVAALSTLAIFLMFTLVYLNYVFDGVAQHMTRVADAVYANSGIYRMSRMVMPIALICPVALAALLFAYLNNSNSVACLHGLPIKRGTFFASHIFSGTLIMILPVVINVVILLLFRFNADIAASYKVSHLFIWAGLYLLYSFIAFNGAAAVAMLTGNSVAMIVFTYIFALLPAMAEEFIKIFMEQQLYGFSAESDSVITDFLYITPLQLLENPLEIVKYVIFAAVLLAAGYYLYKKRKLENNGEIVAFAKLKPVFVYGVAICGGAAGYLYFNGLWNTENILLLIPFGVVGIVIAQMLVKKTLKVKKVYKPIIIFCAAVGVLQLAFQLDISGYEKRIPAIESIESVSFDNGVNRARHRYTSSGREIFYDSDTTGLTSPEEIDSVVKLHEELIKNRVNKSVYDYDYNDTDATITYNLKGGKKLTRHYVVNYETHESVLKPVIETNAVRKAYFPILDDNQKKFIGLEISDRRIGGAFARYYENDKEAIEKIVNALKKDAANTSYSEFAERNREFTEIEISYIRPAKYSDGSAVSGNDLPIIPETYYVRDDYTNTKAVLAELGLYDKVPKAEDIKAIGVNFYNRESSDEEKIKVELYTTEDKTDSFSKVIEDREQIREIYDTVCKVGAKIERGQTNADMVFILNDGLSFAVSFDEADDRLPAILK